MFQTLDQDVSGFKFYSLGIVVKDTTETGGNEITVSPIESLNTQSDGDVFENKKDYKNFHPDEDGNIEENTIESKQYITATWLPIGQSNRSTAPDVIRNETVMLYKFKNVNKYYWNTCFDEPTIRRLEHVVYRYSNEPEELEGGEFNSYQIVVSTKDKKISITTATNDGETAKIDVHIDPGGGNFTVTDNNGNTIVLSSGGTCDITTSNSINLNTPTVNISGSLHVAGSIYGSIVSGGSIFGDSLSTGSGSLEGGGALDGELLDEDGNPIKIEGAISDKELKRIIDSGDIDKMSKEQKHQLFKQLTPNQITREKDTLGLGDYGAMMYVSDYQMESAYYLDDNGKIQIKPGAKPGSSPLLSHDPAIAAAAKLDNRYVQQPAYFVVNNINVPNAPLITDTIYQNDVRPGDPPPKNTATGTVMTPEQHKVFTDTLNTQRASNSFDPRAAAAEALKTK